MPHAPKHLRRSFYEWIEEGAPPAASVASDHGREVWSAERLLTAMCDSSDIIPSAICEQLAIARGSACAFAARRLLAERRSLGEGVAWQRPLGLPQQTTLF